MDASGLDAAPLLEIEPVHMSEEKNNLKSPTT
jgi:hypothetical protein